MYTGCSSEGQLPAVCDSSCSLCLWYTQSVEFAAQQISSIPPAATLHSAHEGILSYPFVPVPFVLVVSDWVCSYAGACCSREGGHAYAPLIFCTCLPINEKP